MVKADRLTRVQKTAQRANDGIIRRPSLREISAQQRVRFNAGARFWHADSRPCGDEERDHGGAGGGLSLARYRRALSHRNAGWPSDAGGVREGEDEAGGRVRHHEALEHESSSRTSEAR